MRIILILTLLGFMISTVLAQSVDLTIEIPDQYKVVQPGDELLTSIRFVNLASVGRVDVIVHYWITDESGKIILEKRETVAVETQANFVRSFDLPADTKSGNYQIFAKLSFFDGQETVADHSFTVKQEITKKLDQRIIYGFLGLLVLLLLVYIALKSKPLVKKVQIKAKVWRIVKKKKLK